MSCYCMMFDGRIAPHDCNSRLSWRAWNLNQALLQQSWENLESSMTHHGVFNAIGRTTAHIKCPFQCSNNCGISMRLHNIVSEWTKDDIPDWWRWTSMNAHACLATVLFCEQERLACATLVIPAMCPTPNMTMTQWRYWEQGASPQALSTVDICIPMGM